MRCGLLLVVAVWAGVLTISRAVGTATILQTASRSHYSSLLDAVTAAFVAAMALLFLASAWRAMSFAPDGPGRLRRTASFGAPMAAVLAALLVATLNVPRLAGREEPVTAWLGGNAGLVFAPARGLNGLGVDSKRSAEIAHPIVHEDGRRSIVRDAYALRYQRLVDGEVWTNPTHGVAILPTLVGQDYSSDWLVIERNGKSRQVELPPFGDGFAIGWSPSAEQFAWKWVPRWIGATGMRAPHRDALRIVLLDRSHSLRTIEVTSTIGYDTQVTWISDRTLIVIEYESESPRRGWWRTVDTEAGIVGSRNELPEGRGLAAPALQQQWGGVRASRLPTVGVEPVAFLIDRDALNLWYRPESDATTPTLLRLDALDQALRAGQELPARSLATTLGNLDDGSLVWASPERVPRLPHWDGGERTRIFRLRSFDAQPEPLCEVETGRLFRYLGQHRDWLVWSTPEFRHEYELWGCNAMTGESRRLQEWEPFANPTITIAEAGIFTLRGWLPLAGEAH
jgi:hypothetical protein